MDILENNVRSECKQAFAELQTDLTDLTMELETTGIPIVPHRAYVMNVFFPGVFWRIFQNWLLCKSISVSGSEKYAGWSYYEAPDDFTIFF